MGGYIDNTVNEGGGRVADEMKSVELKAGCKKDYIGKA